MGFPGQGFPRGRGVSFYGYLRLESRIDCVESPRESRRRRRGVARAGLAASRRISLLKIYRGRRGRRRFLRGLAFLRKAVSQELRTAHPQRRRRRQSLLENGRGRASGRGGGDGVGTDVII